MTEQEQTNGTQLEKENKGFSGRWSMTILLICMLIAIIISGLWTLKLDSQVSSLSSELKTLRTHNSRLDLVEDKLAKMEIQNRLQTIECSIGDISRLAAFFNQRNSSKADEFKSIVAELIPEKELLQKQLDNYQQAIKKAVVGSPDVPRLQSITESEQPALKDQSSHVQETSQNWWEKIINFRLFRGRK